jgi:hypothetical protein
MCEKQDNDMSPVMESIDIKVDEMFDKEFKRMTF